MEGFTNNGELTNPKSTEKTGWDELAESPIGKAPEESSQSEDEGDAAETSVSSRVENGRFVSPEARQEALARFRKMIEGNPQKTTFALFAAPGYEFPGVKDRNFDEAMEDPSHWDPERAALQQESIDRQVSDALRLSESLRAKERERGVDATIYALRGVSAAGKTQAIKRIEGAIVEDGVTVGALAPDTSKRDLFLASGGVTDQIHKESSMMMRRIEKIIQDRALNGEVSDIRDRVLKDVSDVDDLIIDAEKTGRRIEMIDIDVPLEVSAMRLLLREPGGADPNPNSGYLRDQAFSNVRLNRLHAIEQLRDAYKSGRVGEVSYSLFCYDYESKPKKVQREVYRLWVDKETGELREEILNQELFDRATRVTEEELGVLDTTITPEHVESFCERYFDEDKESQKYAQEMRDGLVGYYEKDPPMTISEALDDKNVFKGAS